METQRPGICLSLPPLLWDYKCSTISQVWTHVLFHAGQELYQLCDLSLSEKFPNDSFLTPADPVPRCSDYSGLSPQLQKLFCFTQKKVPGTQRMGGGRILPAPAKAASETIELPVQEQEAWAVKQPSSHPWQQVPDPLRQAARVMSSPNAKHVITTLYACSVSKAGDAFVCAFVERVSLLHLST